ncbi:MAG TPA: crossover junction endodeoxyribonuclease RuvC [Thermoanaerobaculia bacterium]|nr:crossover junction endodeoxyribonuclease RuvC [Thermoanaerobaculia bacterium]
MLILGIDPGSLRTGWGAVLKDGPDLKAVEAGTIVCPASDALPARLARLSRGIGEVVDRLEPAAAVLESPFHGMNARSLIVLAQARGALIATLALRGLEVREFTPAEVKAAVTGNGRAGKDQVARMVRLLLAWRGECSHDASDALAVALCCAQRLRMDRLSETPAKGAKLRFRKALAVSGTP